MNIKQVVESYKDEMIANLRELVAFESVQQVATKTYPFGKPVADCLDTALKMCQKYGFETTNLDNYVGFGEVGKGDKLIGILGHLDVVPLGEGWTHDPLAGEIVDGYMYGRGTSDDKGPVVAAMMALKIVKDLRGEDLNKRIRLIMGCNEESGSRCLKYYVEKEGHINYGFTPDGPFPGCFGEKGSMHLVVSATSRIVNIRAGLACNIVPNLCTVEVVNNSFDQNKFINFLADHKLSCTIDLNDAGNLVLKVSGVAAHASLPALGKNAISYAMVALHAAGFEDTFVEAYTKYIGLSTDGSLMGINLSDEFGDLTFNVGIIDKIENQIEARVDIRFPVRYNSTKVCDIVSEKTRGNSLKVEIKGRGEPLFFEPTSPLVTMLKASYQEVTGEKDEPITMGGGTYAKGINNCIAFGAEFPGVDVHMHDADEFIKIEHLLLSCEIFVNAILKLLDYEG